MAAFPTVSYLGKVEDAKQALMPYVSKDHTSILKPWTQHNMFRDHKQWLQLFESCTPTNFGCIEIEVTIVVAQSGYIDERVAGKWWQKKLVCH